MNGIAFPAVRLDSLNSQFELMVKYIRRICSACRFIMICQGEADTSFQEIISMVPEFFWNNQSVHLFIVISACSNNR